MKISININVDNAAFDDPEELSRVLQEAVGIIEHKGYETPNRFALFDSNGNRTGEISIIED